MPFGHKSIKNIIMDIETFRTLTKNSSSGHGNKDTFTYNCDNGITVTISQKAEKLDDCIKTLSCLLEEELKKAKIEKV